MPPYMENPLSTMIFKKTKKKTTNFAWTGLHIKPNHKLNKISRESEIALPWPIKMATYILCPIRPKLAQQQDYFSQKTTIIQGFY